MGGGDGGGGKEGDWECSSCCNRNYAFRSFCNRCKQPRLLVDTKTPANSKWLPRIGDWICTGCTNNNYASREKCKKCGQPKEVAAMPAVAIHGASVSTHPTYFSRTQGVEQMVNVGSLQQSLSLGSGYLLGGIGNYGTQPFGLHPTSSWNLGGNNVSGFPFGSQTNQRSPVSDGNEWRSGDWMCTCGFHNYSSRVQCKKCDAAAPIVTPSSLVSTAVTALGTKRMATEEIHNWDNKRLNARHAWLQQSYPGYKTFPNPAGNQLNSLYPAVPNGSFGVAPNLQVNFQMTRPPVTPTVLRKGAKQWRDGDWMCSNCNNHNYASRAQCNRCKSHREIPGQQPVSVS